jgi:hypothetical protein
MTCYSFIPENRTHVGSYCNLDALKRYLKLKNWSLIDSNDGCMTYVGPLDDLQRSIRVVLPSSTEYVDTPFLVAKVLNVLAVLERRSVESVYQTIMDQTCDFLRPRIFTPSNAPDISLLLATRVINHFYHLIYDSACLEEDMQPFFSKRRNIGKKYAERCRFGQTFMGSFGFVIEMPISPASSPNCEHVPFERRIMARLARGFAAIRKASEEADVSILTKEYKQGFNANLYETMLELMESLQDYQVEFSFAWSPEYVIPADLKNLNAIRFIPTSILPFLESAAKHLRRSNESQDALVVGKIIQLRDSKMGEDEIEDLENASSNGIITIEWEGKSCHIRAHLSPEEYKIACNAHRDRKTISIKGKPEKLGKYFILTTPTEFKIC